VEDVRAVLGDFEWSFLAMTSQSYSADVTGYRLMTSECVSVVPMRHTGSTTLALLTSHVWLSNTASQLRQVQWNIINVRENCNCFLKNFLTGWMLS